jgi:hypothetical protein
MKASSLSLDTLGKYLFRGSKSVKVTPVLTTSEICTEQSQLDSLRGQFMLVGCREQ